MLATDTPIFRMSRTCIFINILPPDRRSMSVNVNAHGNARLDDQLAYCHRPSITLRGVAIRSMACAAFHRRIATYSISQLRKLVAANADRWAAARPRWDEVIAPYDLRSLCPVALGDPHDIDSWGCRVMGIHRDDNLAYFWRRTDEFVRFPYVDPRRDDNLEAFAFMVICECMAFDSEHEFLKPHSAHDTYAQAAFALGLLDTPDKLQCHLERHCKYRFASSTVSPEDCISVFQRIADIPPPRATSAHLLALDTARNSRLRECLSASLVAKVGDHINLDDSQRVRSPFASPRYYTFLHDTLRCVIHVHHSVHFTLALLPSCQSTLAPDLQNTIRHSVVTNLL